LFIWGQNKVRVQNLVNPLKTKYDLYDDTAAATEHCNTTEEPQISSLAAPPASSVTPSLGG